MMWAALWRTMSNPSGDSWKTGKGSVGLQGGAEIHRLPLTLAATTSWSPAKPTAATPRPR